MNSHLSNHALIPHDGGKDRLLTVRHFPHLQNTFTALKEYVEKSPILDQHRGLKDQWMPLITALEATSKLPGERTPAHICMFNKKSSCSELSITIAGQQLVLNLHFKLTGIGVYGSTGVGKSTFINGLLGHHVLPASAKGSVCINESDTVILLRFDTYYELH